MPASVMVSFPMPGQGWKFAEWLRSRLMTTFGLSDKEYDAVYVDRIVSQVAPPPVLKNGETATLKVTEDTRPHIVSKTGKGVESVARDDWNDLYSDAIRSAKSAIIVLTNASLTSTWCMLEMVQFWKKNQTRRRNKQTPLQVIVLNFTDADSITVRQVFAASDVGNVKLEPMNWSTERTFAKGKTEGGLSAAEGDWGMNERAFSTLVKVINAHIVHT